MKIMNVSLRLLCLAAVASVMAGCVREDPGNCPPAEPNVKINFTLFDEGLFTNEIMSVIAVLFDGQGTYIPPAKTLDKATLDRYAGVELALAPGNYRMVFWANVGNNTEIKVVDGTPALTYKNLDGTEEQMLGNGDPVWYAPAVAATRGEGNAQPLQYYGFTVPADGDYTDEVAFTETHNSVNVYIGGLPLDADAMPTVEITNLTSAATFYGMQLLDDPLPTITSAVQTVAINMDNASYALAAFDTSPLGDMAGVHIVIKNAAGNEILRIPLTDAIAQSGADPTAHKISLLITFGEVNVTVRIWDWEDNNLDKNWLSSERYIIRQP